MHSDDGLDPLRAAWERLEAPEPDRALEDPDEATRAAVAWMRGAWAALEPLPVEVPAELAAERSQARTRARSWAPLAGALAALVVALLAAGLWSAAQRGRAVQETVLGALPSRDAEPREVQLPREAEPTAVMPDEPAAPEAEPPRGVRLAALSDDRMELRSGPVRLILLTNTAGADGARGREDR